MAPDKTDFKYFENLKPHQKMVYKTDLFFLSHCIQNYITIKQNLIYSSEYKN